MTESSKGYSTAWQASCFTMVGNMQSQSLLTRGRGEGKGTVYCRCQGRSPGSWCPKGLNSPEGATAAPSKARYTVLLGQLLQGDGGSRETDKEAAWCPSHVEAAPSPAALGWCPDCPDRIGASVLSLVLRERPLVDSQVERAVRVPSPPITSTVAATSPLDRAWPVVTQCLDDHRFLLTGPDRQDVTEVCPQQGEPPGHGGAWTQGASSPAPSQAFLSFALVFCALVQAAFWRAHSPTQVEDAVLDAYDRAYERALRSVSGSGRQELVAIQDTFWCCGKSSPLGLLEGSEADLCQGEEAARQDCLRGIQSFLRVQGNVVSTLIGLGLAFTVYAMLLSSFIWFSIRSGRYAVSQRARSRPPQEPRVYRRIQEGSPSQRPSKADAFGGRLSPSRRPGQLLLFRDPTHGSGDATVSTRM
ncbi:tetraspanin-32 [Oryx dammah]|uniref:tetraspanin-32 n=1 Tax=Oryx dammah TaxID=59534 RepID=UPI001A9AA7AC|nr:tetraspanin-32 [Oryx dammah]